MKAGNITGLVAVLIVLAIVGYMFTIDRSGVEGITGQAVREQGNIVPEIIAVQPDIVQQVEAKVEANRVNGICDGFGLVRKKINPDGSIEEYCYDPCNGNKECTANWGIIDEVNIVSGNGVSASSSPTPVTSSESIGTTEESSPAGGTAGSGGSSSGGGTGSSGKKKL